MNITIVSLFPELYSSFLSTSLIKRARENNLVHIEVDSFFAYVKPKERIDAPTCGPGAGMLIKPDVVQKVIEAHQSMHGPSFNIFFSPQGQLLDQQLLKQLAGILQEKKHIMLLPSRYEGMDSRVEREYADMTLSIGNYVLMGGDIPTMVLLEGLMRFIPGVIGKGDSVEHDSFSGPFVDYPAYTEPVVWKDMQVPEIVRSGNHKAIEDWRKQKAAELSVRSHFRWVQEHVTKPEDKKLVSSYIPPHYVALCHTDVLIGQDKEPGTTSVTSIDIHDIARSCETYGIATYWIVTPLIDQQKIVQKFLNFWASDVGNSYNPQRQKAIAAVALADSIDAVIAEITQKEGKKPLVIATSARTVEHAARISFFDQTKVWKHDKPVLMLLGTGKGLVPEVINRCDYLLDPIEGFTDFNHLSVRSAAAIILDRWLGIHLKKV